MKYLKNDENIFLGVLRVTDYKSDLGFWKFNMTDQVAESDLIWKKVSIRQFFFKSLLTNLK